MCCRLSGAIGIIGRRLQKENCLARMMAGKPSQPIKFHVFTTSPPCHMVWCVLNTLDLPYDLVKYTEPEPLKTPDMLKLNPFGKVPIIQDGNFPLSESAAISCYLVNKYAESDHYLYPTDPQKRARIDQALHFIGNTLAPAIHNWMNPQLFMQKGEDEQATRELTAALDQMTAVICSDGPYTLPGKTMTLVDLALLPWIPYLHNMYDTTKWTAINRVVRKLRDDLPYTEQFFKDDKAWQDKMLARRK